MKTKSVTIESYAGPNRIITASGEAVRLPVNAPHPAAGETVEVAENWVIGKASKTEIQVSHADKKTADEDEARKRKALSEATASQVAESKKK